MQLTSSLFALAASLSTVSAVYKGFNYDSQNADGTYKNEANFEAEFNAAKNLVGTAGSFTSARLFTMIQGTTVHDPISALQAAANTGTTLLLGLWASAGDAAFANELAALSTAITQYPNAQLVGISVGSEDLYRISPTGIKNNAGVGTGPATVISYINQVKAAIKNTAWASVPVGHVDTWNAWQDNSNKAVIDASDFIGMDTYPYFQNTFANDISNGASLFWDAYAITTAAAGTKPVWVTETGWPVAGPTENEAVASITNAQSYYDAVGCGGTFGKINTWWYTLQDGYLKAGDPNFGVSPSLSTTPLYSLAC